jgi:hypothetical protein
MDFSSVFAGECSDEFGVFGEISLLSVSMFFEFGREGVEGFSPPSRPLSDDEKFHIPSLLVVTP